MGITGKRAKTESLSPAERKVLKSDSEGRPGASGRDSGGYLPLSGFSKRPLFAAIWVVPRRCLRPNVIFMAGMEAFFIFRRFPR